MKQLSTSGILVYLHRTTVCIVRIQNRSIAMKPHSPSFCSNKLSSATTGKLMVFKQLLTPLPTDLSSLTEFP